MHRKGFGFGASKPDSALHKKGTFFQPRYTATSGSKGTTVSVRFAHAVIVSVADKAASASLQVNGYYLYLSFLTEDGERP